MTEGATVVEEEGWELVATSALDFLVGFSSSEGFDADRDLEFD